MMHYLLTTDPAKLSDFENIVCKVTVCGMAGSFEEATSLLNRTLARLDPTWIPQYLRVGRRSRLIGDGR